MAADQPISGDSGTPAGMDGLSEGADAETSMANRPSLHPDSGTPDRALSDDYAEAFGVVVLTGRAAGSEVTEGGAPWRGDLPNARALKGLMQGLNDGFGLTEATYAIECQRPVPPCKCGHPWSAHDDHGCFHGDGCASDWRPADG